MYVVYNVTIEAIYYNLLVENIFQRFEPLFTRIRKPELSAAEAEECVRVSLTPLFSYTFHPLLRCFSQLCSVAVPFCSLPSLSIFQFLFEIVGTKESFSNEKSKFPCTTVKNMSNRSVGYHNVFHSTYSQRYFV